MEAPISERIRAILSDRKQARELVKQTLASQRGDGTGLVTIGNETFRLVRVMREEAESKSGHR